MDYAKEWAVRCEVEMKQWQYNYFVTLTYDDEYLPKHEGIDEDTGEILGIWDESVTPRRFYGISYLEPKDLTKFMKDLRMYFKYHYNEDNIRFFASGEYGEKSDRAHFHIILFNCNIRDLVAHHQNVKGNTIFTSEELTKIWGKGIVGITEATYETACYTAQYMLKKQRGKDGKEFYPAHHQTPEFSRMSRMPGIASKWYYANKNKLWQTDEMILANGRQVKTPKYYDRLFDQEIEKIRATNEEDRCLELEKLREQIRNKRRAAAEAAAQRTRMNTSLDEYEYNTLKERKLEERINKKRRII